MDNALIIFVRNPELGKVKTRLAAGIGKENALSIYIKLLEHTRSVASKVHCNKFVFATELLTGYTWENFMQKMQADGDLGNKMRTAFAELFDEQYSKVVIIGSDCPGLQTSDIESAFQQLKDNDVVIGPAEDGGYYLLGMNMLHPEIFTNKTWSSDQLFAETIDELKKKDLSYHLLQTLNDVDELKDVPAEWIAEL